MQNGVNVNMKRKRIRCEKLEVGMVLAEDVYNTSDQMIIPRKTVLTDKYIEKLSLYHIPAVTIRIEETEEEIKENKTDSTVMENTQKIEKQQIETEKQQLEVLLDKTTMQVKNTLTILVNNLNNQEALEAMLQSTNALLEEMHSAGDVLDLLAQVRKDSDLIYQHSLNVALVSVMLGRWLRLSEEDLKVLLVAGLLHDIGKLLIPENILLKPYKLDDKEYHIIKSHTVRGYHLVKNMDVDARIKYTILMHHERCDGSGYPMGVERDKISSFAKIVAIADVYDAMTSKRSYRDSICPFDVIAQFEKEGLHLFEIEYIMTFLRNIANLYIHNRVKLSDGREGEIIMIHPNHVSCPVVQVANQYIDLSKESEIKISEVL